MSQNHRLTEKQHEIFGIELQRMRNKLGDISLELNKAYSRDLAEKADAAQKAIDVLRQELGTLAADENPGTNSLRSQYIRGNDVMDDIKRKLERTKYLMALPINFDELEREGLMTRLGDKYITPNLNKLPEQVLHRIQFVETDGEDTVLTLNLKGLDIE
jgi:hypothetical protein